MKKSIAISQRIDFFDQQNEFRDTLDIRVIKWILTLNLNPLIIPNSLSFNQIDEWLLYVKPSSFLLTGGNDIGKFPKRDNTEYHILKYAEKNQLPVLGICRGMQFIAKYHKNELIKVKNHINSSHKLKRAKNAYGFLPQKVNSFHAWGLNKVSSDYEILAYSEQDNTIEAFSHKCLPWEGWMWHPEREKVFCNDLLDRFRRLIEI